MNFFMYMYTLLHTFFKDDDRREKLSKICKKKKVKMLLESGMQNLKYRRT